jgi:enamine deaminase RidA (YjgF/YER057c/UK114 family)
MTGEPPVARRDAVFPTGRHDLRAAQTRAAAIRSGGLLFVPDDVASRGDGSPGPDVERQVRPALRSLAATLQAGGRGFDDVTPLHTDPEQPFGTVTAARDDVFPATPHPNSTAVGVTRIPDG